MLRSRNDKVRGFIHGADWHILPTVTICNNTYWCGECSLMIGWLVFRLEIVLYKEKDR